MHRERERETTVNYSMRYEFLLYRGPFSHPRHAPSGAPPYSASALSPSLPACLPGPLPPRIVGLICDAKSSSHGVQKILSPSPLSLPPFFSISCLGAMTFAHSFFCESFTEAKMRHHATWDKPYAALCSVRKAEAARGGETRLTEGDVCQVPVPLYCLNAVVVLLSIS